MPDVEKRSAVSLDLDGVVFPRFPAQLAALKPWEYRKPLVPGNPITPEHRVPVADPLVEEGYKKDFQRHANRAVKPEAIPFVRSLNTDALFGNTGRHNNQTWIEMTFDRLQEAGILDRFEHVYFKPEEWESDEGKYWALQDIKEKGYRFIHYDDNARTVRRLAPHFPDDKFVVVQDLTSGILFSRKEMEKNPNVARIAMRKDGTIDVVHIHPSFGSLPHTA
jgi:hypothetical protein